MLNRVIFTGLHRSGKSTLINQIIENNKNLAYIRLEPNKMLLNLGKFSMNSYLNYFNIYDRFLPIELFASWGYPNKKVLSLFFIALKQYFTKNDIFYFFINEFEHTSLNDHLLIKSYKAIFTIMKNLGYNVQFIKNVQDIDNAREFLVNNKYQLPKTKKFNDSINQDIQNSKIRQFYEYKFLNYYDFMFKQDIYRYVKNAFSNNEFNSMFKTITRKHQYLKLNKPDVWFYVGVIVDYNDMKVVNMLPNRFRNIVFLISNAPTDYHERYEEHDEYSIYYSADDAENIAKEDKHSFYHVFYEHGRQYSDIWESIYRILFYKSLHNPLKTEKVRGLATGETNV